MPNSDPSSAKATKDVTATAKKAVAQKPAKNGTSVDTKNQKPATAASKGKAAATKTAKSKVNTTQEQKSAAPVKQASPKSKKIGTNTAKSKNNTVKTTPSSPKSKSNTTSQSKANVAPAKNAAKPKSNGNTAVAKNPAKTLPKSTNVAQPKKASTPKSKANATSGKNTVKTLTKSQSNSNVTSAKKAASPKSKANETSAKNSAKTLPKSTAKSSTPSTKKAAKTLPKSQANASSAKNTAKTIPKSAAKASTTSAKNTAKTIPKSEANAIAKNTAKAIAKSAAKASTTSTKSSSTKPKSVADTTKRSVPSSKNSATNSAKSQGNQVETNKMEKKVSKKTKNDVVLKVIELGRFEEPLDYTRMDVAPSEIIEGLEANAQKASVQKKYSEIVENKSKYVMVSCHFAAFTIQPNFIHRADEAVDAGREISRQKARQKFEYCICNLYVQGNLKYDGMRFRRLAELHSIIPFIYIPTVGNFSLQRALELRYIMSNADTKLSPIDFFENQRVLNGDLDEIDIMRLYEATKHRVPSKAQLKLELDTKPIQPGKFLLKRGFMKGGRRHIPNRYFKKDPSALNRGGEEMYFRARGKGQTLEEYLDCTLNEDLDRQGYSYQELSRNRLHHFKKLISEFPSKEGSFPLRNDVYMDAIQVDHWFAYITNGLYFSKLGAELKKLNSLPGKEPKYFVLACFLLCLNYGYCDVVGEYTLDNFKQYFSGFFNMLFGTEFDVNSTKVNEIKCCDNNEHRWQIHPMNEAKEYRRAVYVNTTNDGECCYRYMMKSILPNISVPPST